MITNTLRRVRDNMPASVAVIAGVLGLCAAPLFAQTYPGKPIRMIVPFPPGGGLDSGVRAPRSRAFLR